MKKLILPVVLGLAGLVGGAAQAATATSNFNVNITLTSTCVLGAVPNLAMSYTSFQGTAATGTSNFTVQCTNTLPFSLSLDSASVTDGTTGLAYTLALSSSATHSVGPTGTLGGQSGTGASATYYVHGNVAASQGGTATAGTANNTRTLTITY